MWLIEFFHNSGIMLFTSFQIKSTTFALKVGDWLFLLIAFLGVLQFDGIKDSNMTIIEEKNIVVVSFRQIVISILCTNIQFFNYYLFVKSAFVFLSCGTGILLVCISCFLVVLVGILLICLFIMLQ
jgi:hypothetical protein